MLLAVHISDGVLSPPWLLGGIALAGLLAWLGSLRLRDEEIPRIALLTAAFFVASSIHIKFGGISSVHLLLNGLLGVVLGWRAMLAIPLGLLLQAILLGHGGFASLGVNACVMGLPALAASALYRLLRRAVTLHQGGFCALTVGVSAFVWLLSLVFSVALLFTHHLEPFPAEQAAGLVAVLATGPGPLDALGMVAPTPPALSISWACRAAFHPLTIAAALALSGLAALASVRLQRAAALYHAPAFALGLLLGELAVLVTVYLNGFVLLAGGLAAWRDAAVLLVVMHLPIAVLEGVVVGFLVSFLARVKPDMVGLEGVDACQGQERISA